MSDQREFLVTAGADGGLNTRRIAGNVSGSKTDRRGKCAKPRFIYVTRTLYTVYRIVGGGLPLPCHLNSVASPFSLLVPQPRVRISGPV